MVSTRGCNINVNREYSQVQCPGPLTRHASDLALILTILAGPHASELNLGKPVSLLVISFNFVGIKPMRSENELHLNYNILIAYIICTKLGKIN